jgi:hypothetical protein
MGEENLTGLGDPADDHGQVRRRAGMCPCARAGVDPDPAALASLSGRRDLERMCRIEGVQRGLEHGGLHLPGLGEEESQRARRSAGF